MSVESDSLDASRFVDVRGLASRRDEISGEVDIYLQAYFNYHLGEGGAIIL